MSGKNKNIFKTIDVKDASVFEIQNLLLGGVAPRPIALVSTISKDGINNLSPFSFFNAFGANPPIVAFSPSLRGRDGSAKDTLKNLKAVNECVIQVVTNDIVEQVNLSSAEYNDDIDEFTKSGLTPIPSEKIKPMRVLESPFQMECKVQKIIPLGGKNGSGNLVICEVVVFHVDPKILKNNIIEPELISLVGRNSADYYTRASGDAIFRVPKPVGGECIGFDNLPDSFKNSNILSANNLAQLANCKAIPSEFEVNNFIDSQNNKNITEETTISNFDFLNYKEKADSAICLWKNRNSNSIKYLELAAKSSLEKGFQNLAWLLLLVAERNIVMK